VSTLILKLPRNVESEMLKKMQEEEEKARLNHKPWEQFPRQR
jgi:hypothetical protein